VNPSTWWKSAQSILKGKANGAKLLVIGIFLVGVATAIHLSTQSLTYCVVPYSLGICAFIVGLSVYTQDAKCDRRKMNRREVRD